MDELAILGVGMHTWGKWGRNFTEYGVHADRLALASAAVDWRDLGFVSGAITVRCGNRCRIPKCCRRYSSLARDRSTF